MPPTFRVLTDDNNVLDTHPVFSPDGETVLFQRQDDAASRAVLYSVPARGHKGGKARVFFDGSNAVTGLPFNASRPDWSAARPHFAIAFDDSGTIWLLDACTKVAQPLLFSEICADTHIWSYPAWYPSGSYLAVTDFSEAPATTAHQIVKATASLPNEFVALTKNAVVWAGESTVNPCDSRVIAFAGQAAVAQPPGPCACAGGCLADGYAQDCNQIWLQRGVGAAPIDEEQGRAPWFSPCGNKIVFESNRLNPDRPECYRLFVYHIC